MPVLYQAVILAAGRGPEDPMAKAHGISHKCILAVDGVPMLQRVIDTLQHSPSVGAISISIEHKKIVDDLFPDSKPQLNVIPSARSAPLSALEAITKISSFPVLITTADHPLLTPAMVEHFCEMAASSGADFAAGLARAEIIEASYPQTIRTYFRLGADRISGCNLFAVQNEKGLRLLDRWQYLETVRKKPWRLIAAFGPLALLRFSLGRMSLERACSTLSQRLKIVVKPVLMPFAEAAIDVDKPADLKLAEEILRQRRAD